MTEKQRERIVSSAHTLALREGISSLSVRKVAREASIGASTLRYYFPSQDDLRVAVVARHLENTLSDHHIFDSSLDASDRLVECLQQFLPSPPVEDSLPFLPWSRADETELPNSDPELTNHILGIATDHARSRIGRWLNVLKDEGSLASSQLTSTISLLCALVNGLSVDLSSQFASINYDEAVKIVRNVVEKLVIAEK